MSSILHRIGTRSSPTAVYEALTTVQGLSAWWTQETAGDTLKGSTLQFRFRGGGPDMKVTALRKNQLVRWKCLSGPDEWVGTELEFKIKREGKATIHLFSHRHWTKASEYPKDQDISDWG
jgi:uncharacterized protein YndB with AHSA1/START domain